MTLLERVSTLVRANLNDLIEKAEDPEKLMKQIILDMQNQLLQVKTQVAIAIADQHLLEKKQAENEEKHEAWVRKAEVAVTRKKDDDLARAALERSLGYKQFAESFGQQVADQRTQVENLKSALYTLEQKMAEAKAKSDLLIAQHRRSRTVQRAGEAHKAIASSGAAVALDRMRDKITRLEATNDAHREVHGESLDDRFDAMDREEKIDRLLAQIKERKSLPA